ncbi:GAF domain-containing protein [Bacteroidota bacterium]
MKFPRTIGFRITLGFGLLIIAIIFNAVLSYRIVGRMQSTQKELTGILDPSIRGLIDLRNIIHQSADLVLAWDYAGRNADTPALNKLKYQLQTRLPAAHRQILQLSDDWRQRDRETYTQLYSYINDTLYEETSRFTSNLFTESQPGTLSSAGRTEELIAYYEFTENELESLIQRFDRLAQQAEERTTGMYRATGNSLLITGIIIALTGIAIAVLLYYSLVKPIKQYRNSITSMGKGIIPEGKFREGLDEMGQIGAALNSTIQGLRDLFDFSEEIGKGNFRSEFTPLSEDDMLGNSLIRLREDLQNAAIEEEKRKREDKQRNWSNQGIARFSEILREFSGDQQSLANKLISELVKYLGARVGGLFLIQSINAESDVIELIASYAYDRSKHLKKSILPGEGLVGRCVQEGSTIFLTDIPENYIKIKSGLGEDNPKSLMIVPIRFNEIIIGVIEIASLEIFQNFQIEFIERISTSIASSLSMKSATAQGRSKK